MNFRRYCIDHGISIFIFVFIFLASGGILWLINMSFAVACVVEGFYLAGFFLIFLQDYLVRREFYNRVLEVSKNLEEISYLSEFLEEPYFQEGQMLYQILKKDEKYLNDQIAVHQRELYEYKDYVETWVHEIKTPIAVSRLIMENNSNDITKSLSEEMDKVEGFVEQMLYYSKANSLQEDYRIRPVMLKELVTRAVKGQAKFMISEKVTPRFENLDYVVLTDTKWMHFILGQLISNGVKYHAKDKSPELLFSAVRSGKSIVFSIADNGIGIPQEDVGRIFRKGFTGENGRKYAKSTGMGLYVCDTLCKKLGIKLSVSSKVGEGTVFSICLTAASEEDTANISKM